MAVFVLLRILCGFSIFLCRGIRCRKCGRYAGTGRPDAGLENYAYLLTAIVRGSVLRRVQCMADIVWCVPSAAGDKQKGRFGGRKGEGKHTSRLLFLPGVNATVDRRHPALSICPAPPLPSLPVPPTCLLPSCLLAPVLHWVEQSVCPVAGSGRIISGAVSARS